MWGNYNKIGNQFTCLEGFYLQVIKWTLKVCICNNASAVLIMTSYILLHLNGVSYCTLSAFRNGKKSVQLLIPCLCQLLLNLFVLTNPILCLIKLHFIICLVFRVLPSIAVSLPLCGVVSSSTLMSHGFIVMSYSRE